MQVSVQSRNTAHYHAHVQSSLLNLKLTGSDEQKKGEHMDT